MQREIILIAAMDKRRAIGKNNTLPWHLPDDLKRFKQLTLGGVILMGRKTAESLGRALPKRRNLVLTRNTVEQFDGMQNVASIQLAIDSLDDAPALFIIGGGEIYQLAMPYATRLHLTVVDTVVEGAEVFFPLFDLTQWHCIETHSHSADAQHKFKFVESIYQRKT
jgi:dihydrofolate reductase